MKENSINVSFNMFVVFIEKYWRKTTTIYSLILIDLFPARSIKVGKDRSETGMQTQIQLLFLALQ